MELTIDLARILKLALDNLLETENLSESQIADAMAASEEIHEYLTTNDEEYDA